MQRTVEFKFLGGRFFKVMNLWTLFGKSSLAYSTGNFPVHISTQLFFKEMWNLKIRFPNLHGCFQKEVAERICEKEGTKAWYIFRIGAGLFTS